jgi:hypothetical protein
MYELSETICTERVGTGTGTHIKVWTVCRYGTGCSYVSVTSTAR